MSNLFRKPSQSVDANKYETIGFKYNPFPIDPAVKPNSQDERENGSIFMTDLRKDEIEQFKNVILQSKSKINLLMDYAAYRGRGIGKTAFLNYLKREINKDLGENLTQGTQVIYAIYFSPSGEKKERKFTQLSRLILDAVWNEELLLITFCRLRAATGLIDDKYLSQVTLDNLKETLGSRAWLEDKVEDVQELDNKVGQKLKENGVTIFNNTTSGGLFGDFQYYDVKSYFSYDKIDHYWKQYGAEFVFNEVVRIFMAAEFSHIYLFFDEAEKIIISQNFAERREFADNLRYYFVDGGNQNATSSFYRLLMTIHPNSQELLLTHWNAAGLDRFSALGGDGANANTIFFRPLKDKKLATQLASEYLNRARIDQSQNNDKSVTPFTEDALELAIEVSDNIPGKFLKLLYSAIEQSITDKWQSITKENIQNIWKRIVEVESNQKMPEEMKGTKTQLNEM